MNSDKAMGSGSGSCTEADATLRLIASLPAPEGLEDRVHEALRKAPRTARILEWPARAESQWMRSAAAAAIAFVVVGGGWGVYSRVQTARVIAMPPHVAAPGEFSTGGTMRVPQTVHGPVIEHPQSVQPGNPAPNGAAVVNMPAPNGAKAVPAKKTQASQGK
jgi:hypothetical protein